MQVNQYLGLQEDLLRLLWEPRPEILVCLSVSAGDKQASARGIHKSGAEVLG